MGRVKKIYIPSGVSLNKGKVRVDPHMIDDWIERHAMPDMKRNRKRARRAIRKRWRRKLNMIGKEISISTARAPGQIVFGERVIGGEITFAHISADQMYLSLVITLTCHEISEVSKLYFDSIEVPFSGGTVGSGSVTGTFAGLVEGEVKLGGPNQTALTNMQTWTSSTWTANDRQRGCAHVGLRLKWNASKFPEGVPDISFKIKGWVHAGWYSTPAGYSENPAILVLDYLHHADVGPCANWGIWCDEYMDAAAICNESVDSVEAGAHARYAASGVFTTDDTPKTIIEALCSAMDGAVYTSNIGCYDVWAGKYHTPLDTLTVADIVGPLDITLTDPQGDYSRGVRGDYVNPNNNWEESNFPPYFPEAFTFSPVWEELNLPCTTSSARAQRLAKIAYNHNRAEKVVEGLFHLKWFKFKPGDTVAFTYARLGWTAKPFLIQEVQLVVQPGANGGLALATRLRMEEFPSTTYDWDYTTEEKSVSSAPVASFPAPGVTAATSPTGLSLASGNSYLVVQADGTVIYRIYAAWTAPTDERVLSGGRLELEYKKSVDSDWTTAEVLTSPARTSAYISNVEVGTNYDVRVRGLTAGGEEGDWVTATGHTVLGKTTAPSTVGSIWGVIE